MDSYKEFIEKYPDTESFEKAYPPGKKFKWCDRDTWYIVGYLIDDKNYKRKNKDYFNHIVIIKSWAKYKQRWVYETHSTFCFYDMLQLMAER